MYEVTLLNMWTEKSVKVDIQAPTSEEAEDLADILYPDCLVICVTKM